RKVVELKNEQYLMAFASDQTPAAIDSRYFTQFLNQPTAVFLGLEKIARSSNHPVVFCFTDRIKRGYYQAVFKTLVENPKETKEYEITDLHTFELEQIITKRPELWLWSHKRWKFKPEDVGR
ncbi:MAG: lysophospholipid acyltransferase family protein, partial [Daejeonella sp.]